MHPAWPKDALISRSQATKGTRWMPRHQGPMKGAASCDKPRGAAAGCDPGIPEWGNLAEENLRHRQVNP